MSQTNAELPANKTIQVNMGTGYQYVELVCPNTVTTRTVNLTPQYIDNTGKMYSYFVSGNYNIITLRFTTAQDVVCTIGD